MEMTLRCLIAVFALVSVASASDCCRGAPVTQRPSADSIHDPGSNPLPDCCSTQDTCCCRRDTPSDRPSVPANHDRTPSRVDTLFASSLAVFVFAAAVEPVCPDADMVGGEPLSHQARQSLLCVWRN